MQFLEAEAEKAKGQYPAADGSYEAAIRTVRQAEPGAERERILASCLAGSSDLARLQGDSAKADERIEQALGTANDTESRQSRQRAFVDIVAGDLQRERGHFSEARQRYEEALAITGRRAPENPLAGKALTGIGLIELANDRLGPAEQQIQRAKDVSRRFPNSDAYLRAEDAHGMLELAKSNLKAARQDFEENLDTMRDMRGEQHPGMAIMKDHLGLVDLAEGQVDRAINKFKDAEETQRRILGGQHPSLATTLQYLGRAYRMKGSFAEAQKSFDEAIGIQKAKLDKDSPALAATRFEEASLFAEQGKLPEAETLYRDTLLGAPRETRLHADSVRGLALVLHGEDKNPEAGTMIAEWMGLRGQKLPVADPERLPVAMAAAEISLADKNYSEADSKFREILAAGEKLGNAQRSEAQKGLADSLFGQQKCQEAEGLYPSVLPSLSDQPAAQSWERLANCYAAKKQGQKSMDALKAALRVANKPGFSQAELQRIRLTIVEASVEAGPDEAVLDAWLTARAKEGSRLTADEIRILENSAQKLQARERYAMAEKALQMLLDGAAPGAVPIQTRIEFAEVSAMENKNAQAAEVYEWLAVRAQAVNRLSDSEKYLLKAEKLREKDGKPVQLAVAMQSLGDIYVQEKQYPAARPWLERAGETLKQAGLGDSPNYAATRNGLGRVAQAERNFDQAESRFEEAYALLKKAPGAPRTITASVLFNLGNLKLSDGKTDEANADFAHCLELTSQGGFTRENPPPVAEFDRIAGAYAQEKWYDKAKELYESNLKLRRDIFGDSSTEAGWGSYNLAVFYEGRQAYDKAAEDARQALRIFETSAGPKSDEASLALSVLANVYHMQGDGERAIEAAERSLTIQTEQGRRRDELTQTLSFLGELLRDHKNFQRALQVYQRMAALWAAEAYNDLSYQLAIRNIVVAYVYLKDFPNARKSYTQLYKALQKDPVRQKTAAQAYADALQANGQLREAKKVLSQAGVDNTTKGS